MALSLTVALCVSGTSLCPSSRPFIYCSKFVGGDDEATECFTTSADNGTGTEDAPWLFRQYNVRKDRECMVSLAAGLEETSLSLLSPAYFTDGRSVCMMLSVLRPSIVRMENYYRQTGRNCNNTSTLPQSNLNDGDKRERHGSETILHRSQRQPFTATYADGNVKIINDHSSVGDVAMSDVDFNEYETRSIGGTRSSYHSLHALGDIQGHTHTHTCIYNIYTYICIYTYMHTRTHISTHTYIHACVRHYSVFMYSLSFRLQAWLVVFTHTHQPHQ